MALGFNISGKQFKPDRTLANSVTKKVLKATFGDGYEQRLVDGINNSTESFSVQFTNRPNEEIDDIKSDLDSTKGVASFFFTYPDSNSGGENTVKVVCENYNITYSNSEFYNLSATFRRVYEA